MRILAIDTAGWSTSVALWEEGEALRFQENTQEAVLLPHLVAEVLGGESVDQLLVNIGPGSFTGIRVGLAFAKGFASGLKIPLKGIDSFTATYLSLDAPQDVLILLEAHRQDVYGRRFQGGVSHPPASLTRSDVEAILSSPHPPVLAGSGVQPFLEGLDFCEAVPLFYGANALAHGFFKDPACAEEALPFYVRGADVTTSSRSQATHKLR